MKRAMTMLALAGYGITLVTACGGESEGDANQPSSEGTTSPTGPGTVTPPPPSDTTMGPTPGTPTPAATNPMPGTPMDPGTPTPMQPGTATPMEPGTPTPMEPGTPTPMEPGTPTPMEPGTPTPMEPGTPAPMEPTDPTPEPVDPGPVEGAYVPCSGEPPPALQLTEVVGGLDSPISMVTPAGDATTLFVAERSGSLLRFSGGSDTPTTLLSVDTSTSAECGFLAVALHPNFDGESENRIYVSYNPTCPAQIFGAGGSSALEEYTMQGDTATMSRSLFSVDQPEGNHNGGSLMFGPDGYLYYGLGDGGGSNDGHGQNGNGQDVSEPLGSILRFDVDAPDTPPAGNLTSADVGGAMVDGRILHYGVRNPWRFSFDKETGDLYIGDVGQDTREEISFAAAGSGPLNFGWAAREGTGACNACGSTLLSGTTAVDPIHDYATPGGGSGFFQASVTGGFVYRGRQIPGMIGRYVFGDYVRGDIQAITYDGEGGACDVVDELIPGASIPGESLASFAEDADGELYVLNMARGNILKIEAQ